MVHVIIHLLKQFVLFNAVNTLMNAGKTPPFPALLDVRMILWINLCAYETNFTLFTWGGFSDEYLFFTNNHADH